jgi:hypothetical protein
LISQNLILKIIYGILNYILSNQQRAFESKNPVTPEMMEKIAEEERKDEDANKRKQKSSQSSNIGGSEATVDEDFDDYDDFVSRSLTCPCPSHFESSY